MACVDRGPEDPELRGAGLGLHACERRVASSGTGDRRQEDRAAERDDQRRRHETAPVSPAVRGRAHPRGRELSAGHRRRHLTGRAKQMRRLGAMVATRSLRWCWHHSRRPAPRPGARSSTTLEALGFRCTTQARRPQELDRANSSGGRKQAAPSSWGRSPVVRGLGSVRTSRSNCSGPLPPVTACEPHACDSSPVGRRRWSGIGRVMPLRARGLSRRVADAAR